MSDNDEKVPEEKLAETESGSDAESSPDSPPDSDSKPEPEPDSEPESESQSESESKSESSASSESSDSKGDEVRPMWRRRPKELSAWEPVIGLEVHAQLLNEARRSSAAAPPPLAHFGQQPDVSIVPGSSRGAAGSQS